jgi:hypothetical protein
MKTMTSVRAQEIWKAFCGELIDNGVKNGEDVKEALATALRQIAHNNEVKYHQDARVVDVVFYADELYEIADELETL